ncbi:MAG TPA: SGNH/GDSL hydrolase family protein [Flavipsychrobacter sp.]|nr:SGNH/GDSL hydrolase family protein [Flavipsychrobacter sp.]
MKKIYIIGSALCLLAACKPNLKTNTPTKGSADFSRYVAVGNSLTAGYADNSLYRTGQENSYPERLSEQFKMVGGGSFKQPLMPGESGYPSPKLVLALTTSCTGVRSLSPIPYPGPVFDTAGSLTNISISGPYNNVGVPGIRVADYLLPGYAFVAYALGGAPYAYRFYSSPTTERPLDEALKINATFFTCWLGSNDVLGYATSGGSGAVAPPGFPLPNDITAAPLFQNNYETVIDSLTAHGAKGALINIPDVTTIPFFTTIPPNGLTLRKGQADSLNAAYGGAGGVKFAAGANNFVIQDTTSPFGFRQIKNDELILLTVPQDSLTCGGWGSIKPIPASFVLDETEINNVKTYTTQFNQIIATAATKHNLALVDMNSFLGTLQSGISFDGIRFNAKFVTGGVFSLDGVHLTPRGYAIVANHILDAINSKYGASVPMANVSQYNGVIFP